MDSWSILAAEKAQKDQERQLKRYSMNQLVELLDANADYSVSELDAAVFLKLYDKDLDGRLSKAEFLSAVW